LKSASTTLRYPQFATISLTWASGTPQCMEICNPSAGQFNVTFACNMHDTEPAPTSPESPHRNISSLEFFATHPVVGLVGTMFAATCYNVRSLERKFHGNERSQRSGRSEKR